MLHHQECKGLDVVWPEVKQTVTKAVGVLEEFSPTEAPTINGIPVVLRNGETVAFRGGRVSALSTDAQARKNVPLVRGLLDYFPAALAAVAELSRIGNEQHNPGEEMHWAREKSTDEADCVMRHLVDRGAIDTDGVRHTTKVAWRALALLQKELEEQEGAPISRASRLPVTADPRTDSP
jgi:hypothetical protein